MPEEIPTSLTSTSVKFLLGRLKEPSTWAGIAVFIGAFGLDQDTIDRLVSNGPAIAVGLTAVIAVFAPSPAQKAMRKAEAAEKKAEIADGKAHAALSETQTLAVKTDALSVDTEVIKKVIS